jgi:hypothetical protein
MSTVILIICFFCFWRCFGPELACSGWMGGAGKSEAFCAAKRNACIGVFVFGLDVSSIFFFYFLYLLSLIERIPERCMRGQDLGVQGQRGRVNSVV